MKKPVSLSHNTEDACEMDNISLPDVLQEDDQVLGSQALINNSDSSNLDFLAADTSESDSLSGCETAASDEESTTEDRLDETSR